MFTNSDFLQLQSFNPVSKVLRSLTSIYEYSRNHTEIDYD